MYVHNGMVNIKFILIKLRCERPLHLISILSCDGKYMNSPKGEDWLWTPPIIQAIRYRDVFLGSYSSRWLKQISHPYFCSEFKNGCICSSLPLCPFTMRTETPVFYFFWHLPWFCHKKPNASEWTSFATNISDCAHQWAGHHAYGCNTIGSKWQSTLLSM